MPFPKTFSALKAAGYVFQNDGRCRGCQRDLEWWRTPSGRKMPFDPMDASKDESPAVPHHATCPNVEEFRGGAR